MMSDAGKSTCYWNNCFQIMEMLKEPGLTRNNNTIYNLPAASLPYA